MNGLGRVGNGWPNSELVLSVEYAPEMRLA